MLEGECIRSGLESSFENAHLQTARLPCSAVPHSLHETTCTGLDGHGGGVFTPEVGPRQKPAEDRLNAGGFSSQVSHPCRAPAGPSLKGQGGGTFDLRLVLSSGWVKSKIEWGTTRDIVDGVKQVKPKEKQDVN